VLDKREVKEDLRTGFPTGRKPYSSGYDYEDDSDLEEDDGEDILDDEPVGAAQVTTEEPRNDGVADGNSDANSNEPSDIISISDLDSLFSGSPDAKGEIRTASRAHVGKVAVIEDVAFVT